MVFPLLFLFFAQSPSSAVRDYAMDQSRRILVERTVQIMSSHFSSASPNATTLFQSLSISQLPNLSVNHPDEEEKSRNKSSGSPDSGNDVVLPPPEQEHGKNPIKVSIILTGVVSFGLAICLFCIWDRLCRSRNLTGSFRKDERPLLTLNLNDFPGDSSKKSRPLEGSFPEFAFPKSKMEKISTNTEESSSNGYAAPSAATKLGESKVLPDEVPSSKAATPPLPPPPAAPAMPPAKKPSPPGPPPPPLKSSSGPRPPPPPKGAAAPRPPGHRLRKGPAGKNLPGDAASGEDSVSKTKLRPFFWDKVCANPDQTMVWHQISSGSFQFNEEMIESLFGCNADKPTGNAKKSPSSIGGAAAQQVQILDPKKSQNLAILLRALNVTTEEVCEALMEGNELPAELLQTLLKMAPTAEEELKLRLHGGDISQFGTAERFLKSLVEIPFAFKRLDALLYMGSLQEEVSNIKESLQTVEIACQELRSSRLFRKLLEAVLKTGNRMNDGTYRGGAQAFKLDTLLKLADVKGTDGKTTLLHFVVQEIIRSEGMKAARIAKESGSFSGFSFDLENVSTHSEDPPTETADQVRALGLKVVSDLRDELENVKRSATLDADILTGMVGILGQGLVKTKEFLNKDMKSIEEDSDFHKSLECFVEHAEKDIKFLLEEEKRIRLLVRSTTDFFHGNAGKDEGLHLFVIVRDFLAMIEKVCSEIKKQSPSKKPQKPPEDKERTSKTKARDPRHLNFPAIVRRRVEESDSDDDGSHNSDWDDRGP